MQLSVWMRDTEDTEKRISYDTFKVGDASSAYVLEIGDFVTHPAFYVEDALLPHNGMKFSTYDADNDNDAAVNCSEALQGAGW